MKKNISILGFLLLGLLYKSQVTIGKYSSTRPSSPSVLLEFGDEKNKGLILPYTETLPTAATGGTLLYDVTSDSQYKVRVRLNNSWFDLSSSGSEGLTGASLTDFTSKVKGIQTSKIEKTDAKVIIGSDVSTEEPGTGILVLESNSKAMVLPIVDTYDQIPSPSPGMIVYTKSNKQLAVYNGQVWTFWKP